MKLAVKLRPFVCQLLVLFISFRFYLVWFAFFLDWHFFHISSSLLVSKSTWFQCPRLDTCPIKYLLENQMCRVIQELFQRWHVHRLKEQFDVSHARFDLEDDFFCLTVCSNMYLNSSIALSLIEHRISESNSITKVDSLKRNCDFNLISLKSCKTHLKPIQQKINSFHA